MSDLRIDNSFSWSKLFSTWKERKPSRIVALEDQVPTRLGRGEFVAKLSPSFASPVTWTPSQQFLKIKDRCTASGVTAFTHEEATPTSDLWPITSVRNQRKKVLPELMHWEQAANPPLRKACWGLFKITFYILCNMFFACFLLQPTWSNSSGLEAMSKSRYWYMHISLTYRFQLWQLCRCIRNANRTTKSSI